MAAQPRMVIGGMTAPTVSSVLLLSFPQTDICSLSFSYILIYERGV